LSAIVVADVAGYSRLMERDEGGTHARLKQLRERVVDPEIGRHGGRIVKTTGDGFLAEFGTAGAALRFAIGVQRAMASHHRGVEAETRIEFRIGINVGDIIVDDDDVAGDGVNVASRLEALAEPGGICVTAAVRDQVHDDLDARFVDAGEQRVRNIERPIRVYRVILDGAAPAPEARRAGGLRWRWAAVAVALLAAGGAGLWGVDRAVRGTPPPGAPVMSVAVMPFAVTSGTAADEKLADALARDVSTALARGGKSIQVAAYSATSAYRGRNPDARTVGRALNVRYLVDGELRRSSGGFVITLQLIEAESAAQAWSRRFELPSIAAGDDLAAVSRRLVPQLRAALYDSEDRRAAANPGRSGGARDLVARARGISGSGTLASVREAGKLLDEAIALEPEFVPALNARVWNLIVESELDPRADIERIHERMDELSARAVTLDDDDAFAWMTRGIALGARGRFEAALSANEHSRELDPTRKATLMWRAYTVLVSGDPDQALAILRGAREAFPDEVAFELRIACWAKLQLGRYDDAIALCEKAAGMDTWYFDHLLLAAAYGNKGDAARAAAARTELEKLEPGFSIEVLKARRYSDRPAYIEQAERHLYPGLRLAGVPDR